MINKKTSKLKIEIIKEEILWGQEIFKQDLLVFKFRIKKISVILRQKLYQKEIFVLDTKVMVQSILNTFGKTTPFLLAIISQRYAKGGALYEGLR